jgi:hypothetical protein
MAAPEKLLEDLVTPGAIQLAEEGLLDLDLGGPVVASPAPPTDRAL